MSQFEWQGVIPDISGARREFYEGGLGIDDIPILDMFRALFGKGHCLEVMDTELLSDNTGIEFTFQRRVYAEEVGRHCIADEAQVTIQISEGDLMAWREALEFWQKVIDAGSDGENAEEDSIAELAGEDMPIIEGWDDYHECMMEAFVQAVRGSWAGFVATCAEMISDDEDWNVTVISDSEWVIDMLNKAIAMSADLADGADDE